MNALNLTQHETVLIVQHLQHIVTDDNFTSNHDDYGNTISTIMHLKINASELPVSLPLGKCLVKYEFYKAVNYIDPHCLSIQYDYDENDFGFSE